MPKTASIAPIEDREAKEYVYHILTAPFLIGQRIDRYLAGVKELSLSRSYIQKLIKNQRVSVNNHPVKPDY
ncbi:MAG: S4 domain-containing protein, partial [Nitrospirota bacterium]